MLIEPEPTKQVIIDVLEYVEIVEDYVRGGGPRTGEDRGAAD